ncbi:MAG: polysaccharide deacetylase family protein [Methanotrichaceae archaeon]|nr:polysaccharide deacetylase family protein [Methanotrichaceae archaeon]
MTSIDSEQTLSLTIDIEDWYHIPSVCGSPFSVYQDVAQFLEDWDEEYDYLTEPTKKVLDLLDEFGISATFFIVADVAENYPGLVESISAKGHEIACHGLNHACKIHPKTKEPLMSIDEFKRRTVKARETLHSICGDEVIGYRAPNALLGGWMLKSLEEIGFRYDSSVCVNSFYRKTDLSVDSISSYPCCPLAGSIKPDLDRRLVEFPWAFYDIYGMKIPTSGGPCLRFLGANLMIRGLKQSLKRGHTVFYFHPIDISSQKFPHIGKGRPFYWAIKGEGIEKRIRYILKYFKNKKWICLRDFVGESNGL